MRSLTTLILLGLLTACSAGEGGESASDTPATETETITETVFTESATPEPSAPTERRSLEIGDPYEGSVLTMRVAEVRAPMPPNSYEPPSAGREFVGLRLEQCTRPDVVGGDVTSSYVGEWVLVDRKGQEFGTRRTMHGWPEPTFPQFVTVAPGDCVKGWMALEVKKGINAEMLRYRTAPGETGEWRL